MHPSCLPALAVALLAAPTPAAASPQDTERISVSTSEEEGDDASGFFGVAPTLQGPSQSVYFTTRARNFDANDTNSEFDVYRRDPGVGTTVRAILGLNGAEPDGDVAEPHVTPDGLFVLFSSDATNLVSNDTNDEYDAFVLDVKAGTIERVSVDSAGRQSKLGGVGESMTGDGRFVVFTSRSDHLASSDSNDTVDVFLRDRKLQTTICVSLNSNGDDTGNGDSFGGTLSKDGSLVAFDSRADDLVKSDTNASLDCFLRDVANDATSRVSLGEGGHEISHGAFDAHLSPSADWLAFGSFSDDVLVAGTDLFVTQVYLRSLESGEVLLVSRSSAGEVGDDTCSRIGLAIRSDPDGDEPVVIFDSFAGNLVPDDTNFKRDCFVARPLRGAIQRVSVDSDGVEADRGTAIGSGLALSPDASSACFTSASDDLAAGGDNDIEDVFQRGLCWVTCAESGVGRAGKGGFVPRLFGHGGSCEQSAYSIHVTDGLGSTFGYLWIGLGSANGTLFGASFYIDLAQPFWLVPILLQGPPGQAGKGTLDVDGTNVEGLGSFDVFLQCMFVDTAAVRDVSFTNLLTVTIES